MQRRTAAELIVSYLKKKRSRKKRCPYRNTSRRRSIGGMDKVVDSFDIGTVFAESLQKHKNLQRCYDGTQKRKLKIDKPVAGEDIILIVR
jgi:hypothetical protein